jgi:hypothetical protein
MITRSKNQQAGGSDRGEHGRNDGGEILGEAVGAGRRTEQPDHGGGNIGADRDEQAVREVHHVHQAEHERQPRGHDEDQQSHGESRHRQRQPGRGIADQRQRG